MDGSCKRTRPKKKKSSELKRFFLPYNFSLVTNIGQKYGPFGTDTAKREQVTIQIENGDLLAQATSSFIYNNSQNTMSKFENVEYFSFYVSVKT